MKATVNGFTSNATGLPATIKRDLDTVWRHRLLVGTVFVVLALLSSMLVMKMKPQFVAGSNILVVNGNTRDDPTFSSPDLPSIAMSSLVLDRAAKTLHLDIDPTVIKKHLAVKPPLYKSSIMRIEYTDTVPARAASIANGVADELVRYFGEISTARYNADLGALDAELAKESKRLKTIGAQMEARGASAVNAVDDRGNDPSAGRLAALETDRELSGATLEGDAASAASLGVDPVTVKKAFRRDVLQSDQHYHDLTAAVSTSEVALVTEHAQYTDDFPGVPALEKKTASLHDALSSETKSALSSPDAYSPTVAAAEAQARRADAVVLADRAKVNALNRLLASEHARLAAQSPLETLRVQRQAAQAEYLEISSRRAAALANRADALSLGSVVVVDRAVASEVQTGTGRITFGAVLALVALVLAVASAFLAELLSPKLRRITQIEDLYGQPVIATIGTI